MRARHPALPGGSAGPSRRENEGSVIGDSQRGPVDGVLASAVILLVGFGIVMVYSSSAVFAAREYGDPMHFLIRQSIFAVAGLVAMWIGSRLDYRTLQRVTYPVLVLAGIGLLLSATGIGTRVGGAARWIRLGPIGIQPSEVAKVGMILYLSYSLAKKAEKVKTFTIGFLPHVVVAGLFMTICLGQPDFGSAVIIAFTTFALLFVAGARMGYLLGAVLVAVPLAWLAVVSSAYRMERIRVFLDPLRYRLGAGYQVSESILSFGVGGVTGVGLGDGRQKLMYLPAAHNDFIGAIVGEELGLVGVLCLLACFAVITWRGVRAALRAADVYGMLVAFGITLLIGMQVLVNFGVTMGVLPTKGLTLPFVSYGGSSLVLSLFAVGVLLSVSRTTSTSVLGEAPGSGEKPIGVVARGAQAAA